MFEMIKWIFATKKRVMLLCAVIITAGIVYCIAFNVKYENGEFSYIPADPTEFKGAKE